ncbi:signal peptidase I [Malassezia yamatoensis]|uniref:Signal peptidase I n=1 Tax=Malassezia yamatoensis TaxID=253288 RepID=A0AAJ5Z0J0_9BASI|nr:signal peptidase I [Malassezia yamatoensis]
MAGLRRLNKELSELASNPDPQIIAIEPEESNFHRWHVVLRGPVRALPIDKEWNSIRRRKIPKFSKDYPFKGPVAHFESKVYHPNVDENGGLLKPEAWKPSTKTASSKHSQLTQSLMLSSNCLRSLTLMTHLYLLLVRITPDPAKQYTTDIDRFNAKAKEYTQQYSK